MCENNGDARKKTRKSHEGINETKEAHARSSENKERREGIGEVSFQWERELSPGLRLVKRESENSRGLQKVWTCHFDLRKTALEAKLASGEYVMGGNTLSSLIEQEEKKGQRVLFAINGDAYDTANTVAFGMMISDGRLLCTSINEKESLGFTEDGKVFFGPATLAITLQIGEEKNRIDHVNKERKLDEEGLYLLTEDFYPYSASTREGIELIFDVEEEKYQKEGLRIDECYHLSLAKAHQVQNTEEENKTPIDKGKILLSCHANSPFRKVLEQIKDGQQCILSIENQNPSVDWASAKEAIGIYHVLMRDGVVNEEYRKNPGVHPRTVVGIDEKGELILMVNDGRQAGFAEGITFEEIVDFFVTMGAKDVLNFDGGGSSTLTAILPGDAKRSVLNRPSDGKERFNANALLFWAKTKEVAPAKEEICLHLYPDIFEGYGTKVQVLENGKFSVLAKASNAEGFATKLPEDICFSVEGEIGEISQEGIFHANSGHHEGRIFLRSESASSEAYLDVLVLDKIDRLMADRQVLSLAPGACETIRWQAWYKKVEVLLSADALDFSLSDPSIGEFRSSDSSFRAAENSASAVATVSYKDTTLHLPIEIGKKPTVLEDFEGEIREEIFGQSTASDDQNLWRWRYAMPQNGGFAKASINYDERYVKKGDQSLRIDYDYQSIPLSGVTALEIGPPQGQGLLEGQPLAIAMWVYGDANGAWLRVQLAGNKYLGEVYVDWYGWKYVQIPIPRDVAFPYELIWGLRVLASPTLAVNHKKGSIFLDSITAVYDEQQIDQSPPLLVEGTLTPAPGTVVHTHSPKISMRVQDPKVEGELFSGLNPKRSALWINGIRQEHLIHEFWPDESLEISFISTAFTLLRSGRNQIRFRAEDMEGNKFFQEWEFLVDGYNVELFSLFPKEKKQSIGDTFTYAIDAKTYKDFVSAKARLVYPANILELEDIVVEDGIRFEEKRAEGVVSIALEGMDILAKSQALMQLHFRVKAPSLGEEFIRVEDLFIREKGQTKSVALAVEAYGFTALSAYQLSIEGSTKGIASEILLRDAEGNLREGLDLYAKKVSSSERLFLGKSDASGMVRSKLLTDEAVDTSYLLWAEDINGRRSEEVIFQVKESLGAKRAEKIALTVGENPETTVQITWQSSLDVQMARVLLKCEGNFVAEVEASSHVLSYRYQKEKRFIRAWYVSLENLKPNTCYTYQIQLDEEYSEEYRFVTARKDAPLCMAIFGDVQGAFGNFSKVIEEAERLSKKVDVYSILGDIADLGNAYEDWTAIDKEMGAYFRTRLWANIIGNHDAMGEAKAYLSYFAQAKNGSQEDGRDYFFTHGPLAVYCLDTETVKTREDYAAQCHKMRECFGQSEAKFRLVFMHCPPYPMNYNEDIVREEFVPTLEALDVDLVLSGHDHIYSKTFMQKGEKNANGIPYIVAGTSTGAKFYGQAKNRPWEDFVYVEHQQIFGLLEIANDAIVWEAYALSESASTLIDKVEVRKESKNSKEE